MPSILRWKKVAAGVYHATSPWGLYTIDGTGSYGRNRWTVTYPDGDYGMADALAEAMLWAESDAEERTRQRGSAAHATKKMPVVGRRSARRHAVITDVADDDKERVIALLGQRDASARQVARDLLLQRGMIQTGRVKQLIPIGDSFSGWIFMAEITGLGRLAGPSGHRFWVVAPSFKVGDVVDFTTTREPPPTGKGTKPKPPTQQLHPVGILTTSAVFPESVIRRWVEKWWIE